LTPPAVLLVRHNNIRRRQVEIVSFVMEQLGEIRSGGWGCNVADNFWYYYTTP
jgi:hypothetical protein